MQNPNAVPKMIHPPTRFELKCMHRLSEREPPVYVSDAMYDSVLNFLMTGEFVHVFNERGENLGSIDDSGRCLKQDVKMPALTNDVVLGVVVDPRSAEGEDDVGGVVNDA